MDGSAPSSSHAVGGSGAAAPLASSAPQQPPLSTAATVDVVFEISKLLDCGLDRRTVQILMALIDAGVHPGALASVVKELRSQAALLGLQRPPQVSSGSAAAAAAASQPGAGR